MKKKFYTKTLKKLHKIIKDHFFYDEDGYDATEYPDLTTEDVETVIKQAIANDTYVEETSGLDYCNICSYAQELGYDTFVYNSQYYFYKY